MNPDPEPQEVPLAAVPAGQRVRISNYAGGRMFRARLVSLGLTVGQEIQVLQNHRGQLIVGVNGGRVALGRGVSQKILTIPVTE